MNIDDAVNAVVFLLQLDIIINCAEQVANMLPCGGTCAGKYPFLHSNKPHYENSSTNIMTDKKRSYLIVKIQVSIIKKM